MKEKKNILLTFDYELFLGKRSGTVEKSIIIPIDRILKILSDYKHRSVFFIDTIYLLRLKEVAGRNSNAAKDFKMISEQLQKIASQGHEIFIHLHPHWLDASYIESENQWSLINHSRYKVSSFDEESTKKMFFDSLELIRGIIPSANLPLDGYRAGGWSIQPFDSFVNSFNEYNIMYDFSVWRGKHYFSDAQHFDFGKVPEKDIYKFSNDVLVPDEKGKFIEIVISVIMIPEFYRRMSIRLARYLFPRSNNEIGDGIVLQAKETSMPSNVNSSSNNLFMLSIEYLNFIVLPYYIRHLKKNNFLHFITHNKMLTKHNINTFDKFLKKSYTLFHVESDFRKMLPD